MSQIVSFQNSGLIDKFAISTFGVSAKENDGAIGFFGTGLKYAIAILLRGGCGIEIHRGLEKIEFTTEQRSSRGRDFDVVCMDGTTMGFTLELGKTWEMWQAFRELYCNTLDESGQTVGNVLEPQENVTTVIVRGAAFYDEYAKKDRIILSGKPTWTFNNVEVHDRPSNAIYYQGIRVGNLEVPGAMTYNILSGIKLTEDRTVADMGQVNEAIRKAVLHYEDEQFIQKFIMAPKDTYEARVDMNWFETPKDTFIKIVTELDFSKILNPTILSLYRKHNKVEKVPKPAELSEIESQQLRKAIDFSASLDFPVDKYKIHITDDLADSTLGMAYHGEIYIARRTYMQGTKMVAATLIEEFLHLEKGFKDCTYQMQNYLFEKLVSIGEQVVGECL